MTYNEEQVTRLETVLKKSAELIAFIAVYEFKNDDNYFSFIININNLNEHFIKNGNPTIINKLYDIFYKDKKENTPNKEIFNKLRHIMYELPIMSISLIDERSKKRIYRDLKKSLL